jgi:Ankyrin repeats (3 copies)
MEPEQQRMEEQDMESMSEDHSPAEHPDATTQTLHEIDDKIRIIEQLDSATDDDKFHIVERYLEFLRELNVPPEHNDHANTIIVQRVTFWLDQLENPTRVKEVICSYRTFATVLLKDRHDTANGIICLEKAMHHIVHMFPSLAGNEEYVFRSILDVVQLMIENVDINMQHLTMTDDFGRTFLHWVGMYGDEYIKIAELYVDKGVEIDLKDAAGSTALHIAVAHDQLGVVQFLVEHGADMDMRENLGIFDRKTVRIWDGGT